MTLTAPSRLSGTAPAETPFADTSAASPLSATHTLALTGASGSARPIYTATVSGSPCDCGPAARTSAITRLSGGGEVVIVGWPCRSYDPARESAPAVFPTPLGRTVYLVSTEVSGALLDTEAPVISVVSPLAGSAVTPTTPIQFTVTDNGSLRRVVVIARYAGMTGAEVVHDGDDFSETFLNATNARSSVAGGYRFTVLRDGGWPAAPTLKIIAIDAAGNQAVS